LSEKEIVLRSGKALKVKMPPMSLEFMYQIQRKVAKQALVNPEVMAVLSQDEVQELFLRVSTVNQEYWSQVGNQLGKAGGMGNVVP